MKIGFLDPSDGWDYHVQAVDERPLGGSQSAACYLARALVRKGHEVFYFCGNSRPGVYDGVICEGIDRVSPTRTRAIGLDVLICLLAAGGGARFRDFFAPHALILWTQHADDQPSVQPLKDSSECDAYEAIVLVSDWQREQFVRALGIERERLVVRRNAIAPVFENLFAPDEGILASKIQPPVLAYTSTPYRGLNVLLDAWPTIRAATPGARLHVYSSMRVHEMSPQEDEARYGAVYRRCCETEGVDYIGSVPQPELSARLRRTTMLAYPNTYPETSCIAVMEALASGCRVVTTQLGALPETGAGFADLVRIEGMDAATYTQQFIDRVVQVLREQAVDLAGAEAMLRRQVDFATREYAWDKRADEWAAWLGKLCHAPSSSPGVRAAPR